MKNKINKAFWSGPWTIMSFPRQGTSIVYDAKTKRYNFHEGTPRGRTVSSIKIPEINKKQRSSKWYVSAIILAGVLGISLAVNLLQWILK
jgi:hypothetical protein